MIVFPMAGSSNRFRVAGYTVPKYMLNVRGRSVFWNAVFSFRRYFRSERFLFVARNWFETGEFISSECAQLGIRHFDVVILNDTTRGQAETVDLGLALSASVEEGPLTVFNIDTFRPEFEFPRVWEEGVIDGYLEVFRGQGANWSYVRAGASGVDSVAEVAEKLAISDLCCTGLYWFRSADLFRSAYRACYGTGAHGTSLAERYVAPMYNVLIRRGLDIRFHSVEADAVEFCGVPAEYEAMRATYGG